MIGPERSAKLLQISQQASQNRPCGWLALVALLGCESESFRWPDRNPVAHPARLLLNDRNVKGGSVQIPLIPER